MAILLAPKLFAYLVIALIISVLQGAPKDKIEDAIHEQNVHPLHVKGLEAAGKALRLGRPT